MPIFKIKELNPAGILYIWKIEESLEVLWNIKLSGNCLFRLSKMSSQTHKKGFLSVRHILNQAGLNPEELYYNDIGTPNLKDGRSISITHTDRFSAIFISTKKVGIDIEKKKSKIQNIAPKFIKDIIPNLPQEQTIKYLTTLWCIKESAYKAFSCKGVSLKNHIEVSAFSESQGKAIVSITFNNQNRNYDAFFFDIEEDYICSFVISQEIDELPGGYIKKII